jgi:hypothetical protein
MLRTVDYAPLTMPVSSADIRVFRAAARASPEYSSRSAPAQAILMIVALIVAGVIFVSFLGTFVPLLASALQGGFGLDTLIVLAFPIVFVAVFVVIVVAALRGAFGGGGRWERWLRLTRFAEANGLVFSPSDPDPQYPGAIFGQGRGRVALDHLRSASDRFLDYGNYRYVTGSGKNSTTHTWGFLALQLDRSLPHMVLDSRANNGLFGGTNLPAVFAKDQVLHLEGDFDRHFTLFCPKQYERDALYVFTPDLMAQLVDEAAPYDVEIIDKWMFVYSATAFDPRQPALHQRLLRIVETVGAKTLSRTDRYADDRVGDFAANVVAPQGQRLRRGVSIGTIVVGSVVAAFWLWSFLSDAIGAVGP